MAQNNFKTIGEYFSLSEPFVVPYYQRGYKWSLQKNPDKDGKTHFNVLLDDLIESFTKDETEYYLQGVTVKHINKTIEIVDGQQRTASLFILLCALKNKNYILNYNDFIICLQNKFTYKIREKSNTVIQGFIDGEYKINNEIQDIVALNRAWIESNEFISKIMKIEEEKQLSFNDFLLTKVKLIYIVLNEKQNEIDTFSMMNQDKAVMTKTDLIKSNLLREASRQVFNNNDKTDGLEWQINHLRTKLASEWDDWRKWWADPNHFDFVGKIKVKKDNEVDEPNLSGLLSLYWNYSNKKNKKIGQKILFEEFKKIISSKEGNLLMAIQVFEGLRQIQKSLEEWFEDYRIYNWIGLLFTGTGFNKEDLLKELLPKYQNMSISDFISLLKLTYINSILNNSTKEDFINIFNNEDVYHYYYHETALQLLRINVLKTNHKGLKFDFSLYENISEDNIDDSQTRSLEHIFPQNPEPNEYHDTEIKKVKPLINTIGNIVLLPKGLNSTLKNKSFLNKKSLVFNKIISAVEEDKNIGLWLHTLDVFGKYNNWGEIEIKNNHDIFLKNINNFFNNHS